MDNRFFRLHKVLRYAIAGVWLINGLVCKILNLVPRHERIVARILGEDFAPQLTRLIGFSELVLAIWIVSCKYTRLCAWTQIVLVVLMNAIEWVLAPDLLLFGKFNAVNALLFIAIVYGNEYASTSKPLHPL
ncbi:DoxX-like family protein [Spirosoma sp. RP8]|uniref:DoxX-like family protein n=1 Tax=Spirosoma liriopis TaxID=2937440 RepID=A0ABT0HQZ7_9BACT|nr:DoxX-like family protein [Spirosoma liriopis]MCK8494601.1 DoxX-like family protein [Spirosoma liriopis]